MKTVSKNVGKKWYGPKMVKKKKKNLQSHLSLLFIIDAFFGNINIQTSKQFVLSRLSHLSPPGKDIWAEKSVNPQGHRRWLA